MDLVMISGHYDLFPHTQWMLTHNSWVPDITVNGHINTFFCTYSVCVIEMFLICCFFTYFSRLLLKLNCWTPAELDSAELDNTELDNTELFSSFLSLTSRSLGKLDFSAGAYLHFGERRGEGVGGSCEVNMTICLNSAQISCKSLTTREVCHYKRHGDQQGAH